MKTYVAKFSAGGHYTFEASDSELASHHARVLASKNGLGRVTDVSRVWTEDNLAGLQRTELLLAEPRGM